MKSTLISILSAIIASICCLGPFLLIILGLGSLGIGAVIGKYHWYFIAAGLSLITLSWYRYFKEKKTCSLKGCQMVNRKGALAVLIISTLIVTTFIGLNLYTYTGRPHTMVPAILVAGMETISIPIEGMVCFTCEVSVSSVLKRVDGVVSVRASAKEGVAEISYAPDKINIEELINAINKSGYKATLPK